MARAHSIWVVTSEGGRLPIAAFTVKHELQSWLDKRDPFSLPVAFVFRLHDGAKVDEIRQYLPDDIYAK